MRIKEFVFESFYHAYDDDIVDSILQLVPTAQEIWFHGSRATGTHRDDSDTDILVIVDRTQVDYLDTVRLLQKLSQRYDNYDIQPASINSNIHQIAKEEGELLWDSNDNTN
jgi:predicted nucleotidyltransferase